MTELESDMLPPGARSAAFFVMVETEMRRLDVTPDVAEHAKVAVKAADVPGLDPLKLYAEWRNDVMAMGGDALAQAVSDPGKAYLGWLAERLKDPFHVTFRAVRTFGKNRDVEGVNEFVHLRWPQEVAWGHRLRASEDDRTAFFSTLFLRQAAFNPSKSFLEVAEAYESAMLDHSFATAAERAATTRSIRLGSGTTAYRPAFLRLYEVKHALSLDRMKPAEMAAAAHRARESQAIDRNRGLAEAACRAAKASPMSRLVGVIHVARETLRGPDQLVQEERAFLEAAGKGEVALLSGGLPHFEFIKWLRARPAATAIEPADEDPNLTRILASPTRWVESLSRDLHDLGARDPRALGSWLAPIVERQRPAPMDCVVDFGFHLLGRA